MPTPRRLIATATAALVALASPTLAHEISNLTGTLSGDIIGNMDLSDSRDGAPFYGYNPHLLAAGDRAIGRATAATLRTSNRGSIPGFIVNGDFYSTHGTLVVHGVAPKARPGGRTEAVMRPGGSRTPDARPTPNPDRPSLGNRGGKGWSGKGGKGGGKGSRGKAG